MMDGDVRVGIAGTTAHYAEDSMPLRVGEQVGRSASRRPGSATMASSRFRNPSAIRSIVDRLNRSVLYSSATRSRSPSRGGHHCQVEERGLPIEFDRLGIEPVQVQPRAGNPQRERCQTLLVQTLRFLVGEHHLEHRRPARIRSPFEPIDENAERKVLMFKAVGDGSAARGRGTGRKMGFRRGRPSSAPC